MGARKSKRVDAACPLGSRDYQRRRRWSCWGSTGASRRMARGWPRYSKGSRSDRAPALWW
eukprot:7457893-Pyramimonas_sp.AAC.1